MSNTTNRRVRSSRAPIVFDSITVAVTNSLASSSSCSLPLDHLTAYDDPYYSNYTCQQQHLFQQQRQFAAMGAQFSPTCPTALPGLTRVQKPQQQRDNQQYSWARSDYKYLLLKQLRLRRQVNGIFLSYAIIRSGSHVSFPHSPYACPFVDLVTRRVHDPRPRVSRQPSR